MPCPCWFIKKEIFYDPKYDFIRPHRPQKRPGVHRRPHHRRRARGHFTRSVPGTHGGQPAAVHDSGYHRHGAESHAGGPVRPPAVHCRGAAGAGVPGRLPPLAQRLPRRGHHGRPQARGRGLDAGRGRHLHRRAERRRRRGIYGHRQLLHRRRPREC